MGSTDDICVSVGYAGFYDLSLIVGSYSLLLVSMAAHTAQFAFLALFENPHTPTLLFSLSRSRPFLYLHVQTSKGYTENASSFQSANTPLPPLFNTSKTPLLSNVPLPPEATVRPRPHPSPALLSPRKRPSTPMDPCLIVLAAWATRSQSRHPWQDG